MLKESTDCQSFFSGLKGWYLIYNCKSSAPSLNFQIVEARSNGILLKFIDADSIVEGHFHPHTEIRIPEECFIDFSECSVELTIRCFVEPTDSALSFSVWYHISVDDQDDEMKRKYDWIFGNADHYVEGYLSKIKD